ncbi:MAG: pilus assembly protein PilN [Leptolyngbya sp. SIO4C5]|uniref:PilN domain-containing protein n=1 Tax=Sphaerothrix gracilis TaxID=3151835 RepID=UPI0013C15724|nr:pilus assembly protein PilN [Leptolyngbya sp. SIO4C5]
MYGIDINFLNDREVRPAEVQTRSPQATPVGDRRPLYVGLAVALVALAGVGGYWLALQHQIRQMQAREAELDIQISELQSQVQEVNNIQAQIGIIEAENQAIVSLMNDIVPWSALLRELQTRIPERIQIESLSQTGGVAPPNQPEATPPPAGGIEIQGQACSFDDVNDFVLLLQRSGLLDGETVQLTGASLQDDPLPAEDGRCPGSPANQRESLVDYTVRGNITSLPAVELIEEFNRNGTVGLVSRLNAIRDTGVTQP